MYLQAGGTTAQVGAQSTGLVGNSTQSVLSFQNIKVSFNSVGGGNNVGIVGQCYNNTTSIQNSTISGQLQTSATAYLYFGSFMGVVSTVQITIQNITNSGTVIASATNVGIIGGSGSCNISVTSMVVSSVLNAVYYQFTSIVFGYSNTNNVSVVSTNITSTVTITAGI